MTVAGIFVRRGQNGLVLDHVNDESRLLKLWRRDSLTLVNKLEIVRVVDLDGTASV